MEGAARALACMAPMAARVWSTLCPILRRCCGGSTRSRTQAPQAACWRRQGWLHCIQYVLFENAMGVVKLWAVVAGAPRAPQRAHGAVHESPMPGRRVWTPTLSLRTHTGYGLAPCCPPCMRGPLAGRQPLCFASSVHEHALNARHLVSTDHTGGVRRHARPAAGAGVGGHDEARRVRSAARHAGAGCGCAALAHHVCCSHVRGACVHRHARTRSLHDLCAGPGQACLSARPAAHA